MARGKTLDQQSESAKLMSPSCGPQPDEDADGVWSPTSPKVPVTGFPVTTALIPGLKEYRWEEVAQHNTGQSCWCYIGQKVYDVTTWLDAHPGGRQVLLLAAGRDCTDLFTSYHPFTDKPAKLLSKFCIGQVVTTEFPQYQPDTGFYADVRKEVGQYLKKNNLDSKDPTPGLIRLAGMMASSAFFFSLMIYSCSQAWPLVWQLAMAMAFGLAQALPLFHMMHDASHCAIGHSDTWWIWTGRFVMDWFAGASMNAWHNQHILGHHVYTNMLGVDPDLPLTKSGSFRRVCWQQKWNSAYRLQHVYLLFLYGLSALKFRIEDITNLLIFKRIGPIRMNDIDNREVLSQLASKLFWILWRFCIPVAYFGVGAGRLLALSLLVEFVTGYFLNFNFQISHISPLCDFTDVDQAPGSKEWAQSQMATTLDYAHHSSIVTFLNGALNYQAVHHLLPAVSQYHYPALAPIVQRVAKKHGVRYNYVNTFSEAFHLHLQHLYVLGIDQVLHSH